MFTEEPEGRFELSGFIDNFYRFRAGKLAMKKRLKESEYQSLIQSQKESPVELLADPQTQKRWWMFKDRFYVGDMSLSPEEVNALALLKQDVFTERLRKAVLFMESKSGVKPQESKLISEDVKVFVFDRDRGKCVKCGGLRDLGFGYKIPPETGGTNKEDNVWLICKECRQ